MCFQTQKLPEPKPAPLPPDPSQAKLDTVNNARRRFAVANGRNQTILTRLSDEESRAPAARKRLLGE